MIVFYFYLTLCCSLPVTFKKSLLAHLQFVKTIQNTLYSVAKGVTKIMINLTIVRIPLSNKPCHVFQDTAEPSSCDSADPKIASSLTVQML